MTSIRTLLLATFIAAGLAPASPLNAQAPKPALVQPTSAKATFESRALQVLQDRLRARSASQGIVGQAQRLGDVQP